MTNAKVIPMHAPTLAGAQCLDATREFLTKYVSFANDEQADAVTLWILHSHAFAAAETTPRLSIQSAEKQSGKTRLLEVIELLSANPVSTSNISAAALFRLVSSDEEKVTLLVDEVDSVFNSKGKGKEDLRGLLNAGYRKGSCVARVSGSSVEQFPVFAPVALAGIGRLPDTVQDRSIVIRMSRRPEAVEVAKLRRREVAPEADALCRAISQWAESNVGALGRVIPESPEELGDRAADVWEPLLAIADACGGSWPARARTAAINLCKAASGASIGTDVGLILERARAYFVTHSASRVSTTELLKEVKDIASTPKQLASMLRPLGIQPRTVRDGERIFKGYLATDFA